MIKSPSAVRSLAAFATISGLTLSLWSFFGIRSTVPEQDFPVVRPISQNVGTVSTEDFLYLSQENLYFNRPKINSKIGTITLESLNQSWPIFEGTKETQLSKGVGHFLGSVLPGVRDNSILSGHRTTVFKRLGELEQSDYIFIKTKAGTFTYEVRSFKIVKRSNQNVIGPTPTPVLTLTTCYPFNAIGKTTEAFIVTADLIHSELNKNIPYKKIIDNRKSKILL
jgi:sortase A